MKQSERLRHQLQDILKKLIVPGSFRRTSAGRHQRANGAWCWCMKVFPANLVGSHWTVRELLSCKGRLEIRRDRFGDWTVDRESIDDQKRILSAMKESGR